MDKKSINKIKRQMALTKNECEDYGKYDDIAAMKWSGIPGLKNEEYYVEYIDTAGRDVVQQAANVYAVQRPKWDVLPRGVGAEVKTAENFERIIEWYMWKAAQLGGKPFSAEAMTHIGKYNKVCGQLEWIDDDNFYIKNYHPSTVKYEFGAKLQWVAVVNNVPAVSILEHWNDYAKPGWFQKITSGDTIGAALKDIQELVDKDEEQRMMYVDFTSEKKRFTYCYAVEDEAVDETLGFDDDGEKNVELIEIQDKENELGFINWAIAESEGDPLLAPLLKGKYYDNINDLETMKATNVFRRGLFPMFIQHGREDASPDIDFSGHQVTIMAPNGAQLTQTVPYPLDPAFNELSNQMRARMNQSLAIQNVSQVQVSNVQHSTLDAQIKMWLMQFEPNKRCAEKYYERLAHLMFMWAKKKDKVLTAWRMYSSGGKAGKGSQIMITADQINLDALYVKCKILANNPTDVMQVTNSIVAIKQAGIRVPDKEFIEQFDMGDPEMLGEEYEKQEIRTGALQYKLKKMINKADSEMQAELIAFKAQMEAAMQAQMAGAGTPPGASGGTVPAEQGLPTDAMTSGQGFDAAQGGESPQAAVPEITQAMR